MYSESQHLVLSRWPLWPTRDTDSPNLVSPGPSLSPQRLGPPNFSTFSHLASDLEPLASQPFLVIPDILGPKLATLLSSPGVTDVLINGFDQVWLQRSSGPLELGVSPFESEQELGRLAQDLIASGGRHLDQANPFCDVAVGGNIRVHASLASACHPKTLVSIRLHLNRQFGLDALRSGGMFGEPELLLLRQIIARRENFLIAGGAGTGKTTLLRAMLGACQGERVIAVEDVSEIGLESGHFISLQTRQANIEGAGAIGLDKLLREALRMRPDRLAVGEVRGAELLVMLQALNTGHSGGGATIHASGFDSVANRIGSIAWQCGLAANELIAQAKSAIDWLIYVGRENGQHRLLRIGRFT